MYREMKLNEIKIQKNPRTDFGEINELVDSIKEQGILEPLLVTTNGELISGERRLRAAKILNMETVPVKVLEADDNRIAEIKLVENIQRKNLNPIEEGIAFDKYLSETAYNEDHLANKIGKTKDYILRRIALKGLTKECREALVKRKIQLGHAVVLARLESTQQNKTMKEITSYGTSVADMSDVLDYELTKNLETAPFNKSKGTDGNGKGTTGCKNCPYNGSEQTLLIDAGDAVEGVCLRPKCFLKKVSEWLKAEKEALAKKGICVMDYEKVKEIKGAYEVHSYHDKEYKKAVDNLEKEPDTYVVVFYKPEYTSTPDKQIWKIKFQKSIRTPEEAFEEAADKLNMSRAENLKMKVQDFKRGWLIEHSQQLLKPGPTAKVVIMHKLMEDFRIAAYQDPKGYKSLFRLKSEELDKKMTELAKEIFYEMDTDILEIAAKEIGVNGKEHFKMTEEFLNLHQKVQLEELAKELKISIEGLTKNGEIKQAILDGWKIGQVPKIMGEHRI